VVVVVVVGGSVVVVGARVVVVGASVVVVIRGGQVQSSRQAPGQAVASRPSQSSLV
jgi:hypothetical protein